MQNYQDYIALEQIGIRVWADNCQVIRKQRGSWREIGPVYSMPVDARLLTWKPPAIPPGVLAVALHVLEVNHPGSRLRYRLMEDDRQRRLAGDRGDRDRQRESAA